MASNYKQSTTKPPFIRAKTGVQSDPVTITAANSSGDMSSGIIPANASVCAAASSDANYVITLPTVYVAGSEILISVGAIGCELRTPVTASKINNVITSNGSAQIKELPLSANTLYRCIAQGGANWTVTSITNEGAVAGGGAPDGV